MRRNLSSPRSKENRLTSLRSRTAKGVKTGKQVDASLQAITANRNTKRKTRRPKKTDNAQLFAAHPAWGVFGNQRMNMSCFKF